MSDLVEEVARAICCPGTACMNCAEGECAAMAFERQARAAIAVVIERCAKVAEDEKWSSRHVAQSYADGDAGPEWFNEALDTAASAIRKLGESE